MIDEVIRQIEEKERSWFAAQKVDKHLAQLDEEIARHMVGMLHEYFLHDDQVTFEVRPRVVREIQITGKYAFSIVAGDLISDQTETIKVNRQNIDGFSIQEQDDYKGGSFSEAKKARKAIQEMRVRLRKKYKINDGFLQGTLVREFVSPLDPGLEEVLKKIVPFVDRPLQLAYKKQLREDVTALTAGLLVAAVHVVYLTLAYPAVSGSGGGGSGAGEARSGQGHRQWVPDGRQPLNDPSEYRDRSNETPSQREINDLADRFMNEDVPETEPVPRPPGVNPEYFAIARDLDVRPHTQRQGAETLDNFFPPESDAPYQLSRTGTKEQRPQPDINQRRLILVYDATGSMDREGVPEDIFNGNPAPGYMAAIQFIHTYSKMGAPLVVLQYPLRRSFQDATNSLETASPDAAAQELEYKSGGADDGSAVERVAVFIAKKFENDTLPSDVVFITDSNPSYNSAGRFMDLVQGTLDARCCWINVTSYPGSMSFSRSGREFHVVDSVDDAYEAVRTFAEGYTP